MITQKFSVKYQTRVRDAATGKIVSEQPWRKNLIMDSGLDAYSSHLFCNLFSSAVVGSGTNPVMRYSSPVTFTQSGNTVTASAPFFASTDVGYILKYGASGSGSGGAEQYVTGFTDSTHVTVSSSASVGTTAGALWYVTQTALQTQLKSTTTYSTIGNGTVITPGSPFSTYAHTRVFIFATETGPVTYNEIGWSWNSVNLFGRDLITPSGVSLISGQQLEVTLQVSLQISPTAPVFVGDVSSGTWNTAGTSMLEYTQQGAGNQALSQVNSSTGATQATNVSCEPGTGGLQIQLIEGSWTQRTTLSVGANPNANTGFNLSLAANTYTNGTFLRTYSGTIPLGSGNGVTYTGIGLTNNQTQWSWSLQLTTPNSKDASHTLSFTMQMSWGRILVN
jgi:hypothetical protein